MASETPKTRRLRAAEVLMLMGALVIVIAGLKAAQSFFVPVLLAFFIATISFPITNWLRNHRVPRVIAVLLTVLVDFAFLAGIVFFALSVVGDLQTKWNSDYAPRLIDNLQNAVESISDAEENVRQWWQPPSLPEADDSAADEVIDDTLVEDAPKAVPLEPDVAEEVEDQARLAQAAEVAIGQLRELKFTQIWTLGTDVVGRVVRFIGTSLIVIILTIFMLTEARMFGRRMEAVCEARGPNIQRMLSALKDTQRYLGIKTGVSLATGFLAGLLCWAANVDFWPLWAILAFALNYIPVVGSFIAGLPPTALALLTLGTPEAVAVGGGYFLINTFLGNVIEPMLMGRRFGLSTLVVLVSVIFWGWLWGPLGMLLAVPLTMMLKVVLDNSEEFRWIAVAIGKESNRPGAEKKVIVEGNIEESAEETHIPNDTADAVGRS